MSCHAYALTWVGVRPNASLRLGFYTWHSSTHGSFEKNFVIGIFGVWIFGLLHIASGKNQIGFHMWYF